MWPRLNAYVYEVVTEGLEEGCGGLGNNLDNLHCLNLTSAMTYRWPIPLADMVGPLVSFVKDIAVLNT